ncbi:hypothetical protein AYO44_10170 [Planctomycetaceae bacterium SCGC AG-212-F19]|nr:hypothetical protein AYO44_10170 [Planctomycetaceae bacterium SCGC AG-212-F19]
MPIEFIGTVVSVNGETIYQRVAGTIFLHDHGTSQSWDGILTIESGEPPSMFRGIIVTDTGGRGEAVARRFPFGSDTIEFAGTGNPPIDKP